MTHYIFFFMYVPGQITPPGCPLRQKKLSYTSFFPVESLRLRRRNEAIAAAVVELSLNLPDILAFLGRTAKAQTPFHIDAVVLEAFDTDYERSTLRSFDDRHRSCPSYPACGPWWRQHAKPLPTKPRATARQGGCSENTTDWRIF